MVKYNVQKCTQNGHKTTLSKDTYPKAVDSFLSSFGSDNVKID